MRRLLLLAVVVASTPAMPSNSYTSSIETWRKNREATLKAPEGWLAVAGLFWLKEGVNRVGSAPGDEIALPSGRAPAQLGVFEFHNSVTTFRAAPGAQVTVNGKPAATAELKSDAAGATPDLVQSGDFTMFVIKRGDRFAIRMRDVNSAMRREFTTLHWYPVNELYRVTAKFTSYDQPKTIAVPNILGTVENEPSPGYATFQLMGHSYRLDAAVDDNQLFFVFRDLTAGKTTYGAGRFLKTDFPKEGKIVLDFNKAYNPPCAFTPFATCPLPTKQNRMAVKIEAGELKYGDH